MKSVAQLSLLLAAIAALGGCAGRRTITQRLDNMRANCVLIVIDAAAAKHLHTYGNTRQTTPNLDRLASEGVLFERAYSQAPSTIVSVPSFMTGLYPHSIAVLREQRRAGSIFYLPQAFAAAGFRTAGFTENVVVALSLPGAKVFEHFGGHLRGPQPADSRGARLVGQALSWVDSIRGERFFIYLHLLPPHAPYLPPAEHVLFRPRTYRGKLRPEPRVLGAIDRGLLHVSPADVDFLISQYDANLHYADALVALFVDGLKARGQLERTVVIVTSDHGEAFGEHGRWQHNTTLYDEMIRVPLIVVLPRALGRSHRRISETVALVDLAPTLEDLFGLGDKLQTQGEGVSLRGILESDSVTPAKRMVFAQRLYQVAAVSGDLKLILSSKGSDLEEELYHLSSDPEERENIASRGNDELKGMRHRVERFLDGGVARLGLEANAASISAETRRQLNALGYLMDEGQSAPRHAPGPE